jgi:hypothetical protein
MKFYDQVRLVAPLPLPPILIIMTVTVQIRSLNDPSSSPMTDPDPPLRRKEPLKATTHHPIVLIHKSWIP